MITKVFAVYDSKAQNYGVPFFMQNKGMALRSFMDFVNDEKTMINKHPEDFSLFCIGEYDDANGVITMCKPENLGNAASFKSDNSFVFTAEDSKQLMEIIRESVFQKNRFVVDKFKEEAIQ